jgi:leukotriene-A4 hydrolase
VVEEFAMEQPVPTYLFAFAVGELGCREVGPRTMRRRSSPGRRR